MREKSKNQSLEKCAMKAGMSEKTAKKYIDSGKLPSEVSTANLPRKWNIQSNFEWESQQKF